MQVRPNRVVQITMTLTNAADQTLIDDTHARRPYAFFYGGGELLDALENQLKGMKPGEIFDVTVEQAYGAYNNQMVQKVAREKLPPSIVEGMALTMQIPGIPNPMVFKVKKLTDKLAHLDGNHPMAGQDIRFRGVILDVRPATDEEMAQKKALTQPTPEDVCPPA